MRKIMSALLWVGIMAFFSACGEKEAGGAVGGRVSAGGCEQSAYFTTNTELTIAPEGYYSLSGMSEQYLTYISKDTGKETVLCSKPECIHIDGPFRSSCIETCNGYVGTTLPCSITYRDGYVYLLKYDYDTFDVILSRVSADGSVHEDIMRVGQSPDQASYYSYAFVDDNTIMMVYNPPDFTGEERTVSLDRIDLDKKKQTTVYSYTDAGAGIIYLKVYDGKVFFTQMERTGNPEEYRYEYHVLSYDLKSGQVKAEVEENTFSYTLADNGILYYYRETDGLYRCDLQTGAAELIRECDEDTMYALLAYDGTYLYLDNFYNQFYYDENSSHKVIVCDLDGRDVNEIATGYDFVTCSEKDYMFIRLSSSEGMRWWYINKEDIADPSVTWKAVDM